MARLNAPRLPGVRRLLSALSSLGEGKGGLVLWTVACLLLTALRLMVSLTLHMHYYAGERFDDRLMMEYASLDHFTSGTDTYTLAKSPGYALWLLANSALGISGDVAYFLMWLAGVVMTAVAMWRISHSRPVGFLAYVYVIWNPIAFENWLGTRAYRNSLFPPLLFLTLGACIIWLDMIRPLVGDKAPRSRQEKALSTGSLVRYAGMGVALGISFLLLVLLKEDSVWCVPIALLALGYQLANVIRTCRATGGSRARKAVVVCLTVVPLLVTLSGIGLLKAVTYACFGVPLVNTRTEGEVAGFVARVYQIRSHDQSTTIWSPKSSIEAAFSASETLSESPELLHCVEHGGFVSSDLETDPLRGDFLTWQIRAAYDKAYGWDDEAEVQEFFGQVNGELDQAFEAGELTRTEKFSPSSLLVPRNAQEILDIVPDAAWAFARAFDLGPYAPTTQLNYESTKETNLIGLEVLGVDVSDPNPELFLPYFSADDARQLTLGVLEAYRVINVLLAGSVIAALLVFVTRRRGGLRGGGLVLVGVGGLLVYGFAYCYSATWFAEYLGGQMPLESYRYALFFYTACVATPFIDVALMAGAALLVRLLRALPGVRGRSDQITAASALDLPPGGDRLG